MRRRSKLRILVEVLSSRERREDLYRIYGGGPCGFALVRGFMGTLHRVELIDGVDTWRLVQAIEAIEQRHAPLTSDDIVVTIIRRNHGNTTTRRPSPGEGAADS